MAGFAVGQAVQGDFADVAPTRFDPPPTPFWSAVQAGFDDQTQTRNTAVREEALRAALWERHMAIQRVTGKTFAPSLLMAAGQETADPDAQRALLMGGGAQPDFQYEAEIEKQRQANPAAFAGIDTRDQVQARLDKQLRAVRARSDQAGAEHPVAGFLGSVGGTFLDPINDAALLATGPLGAGRSLAGRLVVAGVTNAGLEAAGAPARLADAQIAGPPDSLGEEALNIAAAGVAGVAFHGGVVEPLSALSRRLGLAAHVAPEVRAAAHVVDTAARDDAAIGPVDGQAHEAGLGALMRGEPPPAVEPAQELGDLFGDTPTPRAGPEAGPITGEADYLGRRILQGSFDPKTLQVDPARFQYKAEGDAAGVTARLKGVEAWDPTASGKVIIYEDLQGNRTIADGHQRLGLARRLDSQGFEPKLDGYLFREADGWTSRQVRTISALKNIREGSGTILDAAKIFRDAPDIMRDPSLPVTGDFITTAKALARLDPEAFGAVVNKVIPERYGAEIGAMAGDRPDLHAGLVRLLKEGEPGSLDEARALISEARLDDWIKTEGEQSDMFGGLSPESTTIARAKVKAAVLAALRKDARVYGQLVKHADAIEAGGNVLLRDANEQAAVINRTALEVLSRLSLRSGEVGEAIAAAAREVLDGKRPADAARGLVQMVRNRLKSGEQLEGLRLTELDPKPPAETALALLDKVDDPKTWEAIARPAPEDAAMEAAPPAAGFHGSNGPIEKFEFEPGKFAWFTGDEALAREYADVHATTGGEPTVTARAISLDNALRVDMAGKPMGTFLKPDEVTAALERAAAEGKHVVVFDNTSDRPSGEPGGPHAIYAVLSDKALGPIPETPPPGLFDDIAEPGAEERAHARLIQCAPGE